MFQKERTSLEEDSLFPEERSAYLPHMQRSLHSNRRVHPDIQLSLVLPAQGRLSWVSTSSNARPLWKVRYQSLVLAHNMG